MFAHDFTKRPDEVVRCMNPPGEHREWVRSAGRQSEVYGAPDAILQGAVQLLRKCTKQSALFSQFTGTFYFWKIQCL